MVSRGLENHTLAWDKVPGPTEQIQDCEWLWDSERTNIEDVGVAGVLPAMEMQGGDRK